MQEAIELFEISKYVLYLHEVGVGSCSCLLWILAIHVVAQHICHLYLQHLYLLSPLLAAHAISMCMYARWHNVAGEIVIGALKNMKEVAGFEGPDSQAATTLLAVCPTKFQEDRLRIDACEIGDSRWALMCWDTQKSRYVCSYLADA